eukprot:TRINITY_DN12572_c4_g7_i1.p2 TRINITY_DN12572_c4_g7~~TRINITY_DN12572_c4_g7_i1.p2  ORF type:complete len:257 (+),score=17.53 TRINITY_DN12572_c4_g7_i1:1126-1896(+)
MVVSEKVQRIIDSDGEPGFVCTPAGRMYGRMTHSASSAPFIPPLFPFSFPVPSQQQPAQPEQQQPNPAPNVRLERLTPQQFAERLPPVAGWRRILAEVVDLFVFSLIYTLWNGDALASLELALSSTNEQGLSEETIDHFIKFQLGNWDWTHFPYFYFGYALWQLLFHMIVSATPGKVVTRTMIVSVVNGQRLTLLRAFARCLLKTALLAFVSALLFFPLFTRRDTRGVYDKVLGLKVVDRRTYTRVARALIYTRVA